MDGWPGQAGWLVEDMIEDMVEDMVEDMIEDMVEFKLRARQRGTNYARRHGGRGGHGGRRGRGGRAAAGVLDSRRRLPGRFVRGQQ